MTAMLKDAVNRIRRAERLYDTLRYALHARLPLDAGPAREAYEELSAYLEGGRWLADLQLDEAGALPKELKRGVLSEDGLYDLLCAVDETVKFTKQ